MKYVCIYTCCCMSVLHIPSLLPRIQSLAKATITAYLCNAWNRGAHVSSGTSKLPLQYKLSVPSSPSETLCSNFTFQF